MTREDIQKLLILVSATYPNFKPEDLTGTVDAWLWLLKDYDTAAIMASFEIYVKTDRSGFAPSVSQLIGGIHEASDNSYLTESQAWALVKKAIQDGNYHAVERFEELPPLVQKAVGSANMIQQWAGTDSDEVNTVIMSNFQRAYRTVVERAKYDERVPSKLQDICKAVAAKVSLNNQLEIAERG